MIDEENINQDFEDIEAPASIAKASKLSVSHNQKERKFISSSRPIYRREKRRKAITRPVGDMIPDLTRRALGKYGFGQVNLITDWENIVGENLSKYCRPIKINFPRGKRMAGLLHIQVMGPMALELQHMQHVLIDRINAYFGYGAVADIRLKQTSNLKMLQSDTRTTAKAIQKKVPLQKEKLDEIKMAVSSVEDNEMRKILQRIGESVARRNLATKSK